MKKGPRNTNTYRGSRKAHTKRQSSHQSAPAQARAHLLTIGLVSPESVKCWTKDRRNRHQFATPKSAVLSLLSLAWPAGREKRLFPSSFERIQPKLYSWYPVNQEPWSLLLYLVPGLAKLSHSRRYMMQRTAFVAILFWYRIVIRRGVAIAPRNQTLTYLCFLLVKTQPNY